MSYHAKAPWITPRSTHIMGAKYLYREIGFVANINTGPPRTTLNKKGQPIVTRAALIPRYYRYANPARAGKPYREPFLPGGFVSLQRQLAILRRASS